MPSNKLLKKAAEKHVSLALSAYRLTLAICHLNSTREQGKKEALAFVTQDFFDALEKEYPDIRRYEQEQAFNHLLELIGKVPNWKEYVCGDAAHLFKELSNMTVKTVYPDEYRLKHYHARMQEQLDISVLSLSEFDANLSEYNIIDIGCGSLSYFKRLIANKNGNYLYKLKEYIGIDKRKQFEWGAENVLLNDKFKFIPITYEQYFKELGCNNTNMVYIFELLHCIEDIEELFYLMFNNLQKLKVIKIIELNTKEDYGLSFGFDYHMSMHTKSTKLKDIEDLLQEMCYRYNLTFNTTMPTVQHNMYTLETK
jgi:hypothetical protein